MGTYNRAKAMGILSRYPELNFKNVIFDESCIFLFMNNSSIQDYIEGEDVARVTIFMEGKMAFNFFELEYKSLEWVKQIVMLTEELQDCLEVQNGGR